MKIIVRAPNWIGDAVLALPALESLSRSKPEAEIWIAGRDWVKDLFLPLAFIHDFISQPDSGRPKILWEAAKILRQHHFDAGLLLTNSFASALVFFLAGIPQRWGYARDGRGILLTKGIRHKKGTGPRHQMLYYLDLISSLGFDVNSPELRYRLDEDECRQAKIRLAALDLDFEKPIVVLNPGAYFGPAKRWPPVRFAELAGLIQERAGAQILIIGSSEERELAENISAMMKTKPIVLSGETTLLQLAGILKQASLFITNDTGPMHLAHAMKVPVVAIFGPTDPDSTGPILQPSAVIFKKVSCWPCKHRKCPTDHKCMFEISAEDVYCAGERFLN